MICQLIQSIMAHYWLIVSCSPKRDILTHVFNINDLTSQNVTVACILYYFYTNIYQHQKTGLLSLCSDFCHGSWEFLGSQIATSNRSCAPASSSWWVYAGAFINRTVHFVFISTEENTAGNINMVCAIKLITAQGQRHNNVFAQQ